ncbi:MAG: PAS domain S-box-containing protein [Hyphomicrobiaceae bacterium]|jgi:PAS domain S-box-containing protein
MNASPSKLELQRDRYALRYERERDARHQAESIAERALREITQRNRELLSTADQSIRDQEARLHGILEGAVEAIITITEEGVIEEVNSSTEKLFGYKKAELLGANVWILMPDSYSKTTHNYLRTYVETGEAKIIGVERESRGRRKNGSTFPIGLSIGEVWLGDRRLFTAIVRDITRRKIAEKRLEETLAELQKTHDGLLAVLNGMNVGSILIDPGGLISFVSIDAISLPLRDPIQAIGQKWEESLTFESPRIQAIARLVALDAIHRRPIEIDWVNPRGEARHARIEIKDDPREAGGWFLFIYDLSELTKLRQLLSSSSQGQMIGSSNAMRQVYDQIQRLSFGNWTVLIEGETGVGKELVARAIHSVSTRQAGPFVAVNCAGMGDSLLESQLFGHRKGAFTDAIADQRGIFEAACGGTILLDEIGDISDKLQKTLLRVVQEREISRVGENKIRKVDVRILVATNRDLNHEVAAGRFREDLLYRIKEARLRVPPLRERVEDIPSLITSFLAEQRMSAGKAIYDLDSAAQRALEAYHWPGNVRELRSAISFAVIACEKGRISVDDLPPEIRVKAGLPTPRGQDGPSRALAAPVPARIQDDECLQILAALEWAEGNRARAARKLGIGRSTLYHRMRTHGIPVKKAALNR